MDRDQVRVVLVDDHAILRDGLRALLEAEAQFQVVGEASNGREAIRVVNELKPDLVITDVTMPLTNGTEAIRIIKKRHPEIKMVALTIHSTERYVRSVLACGADAYVLKDDPGSELCFALRHAMSGKKYLSPGISRTIVEGFLDGASGPPDQDLLIGQLTHREAETLKLIAEGLKNREIAEHLCVSVKTVEKHRANVMRKLDLHNGPALTAYAYQNGLATSATDINQAYAV